MLTIKEVKKQLQALMQFLKPVHSLASSHFGSFFTEQLWEKEIPANIQHELNNPTSINNFISLYPKIVKNNCSHDFVLNHPNLMTFLESAINVSVNKQKIYQKLLLDLENISVTNGLARTCDIKMEDFMSPKKLHEVKMTSKMAALISDLTESTHIVDIGGGKGYLSCILALHYSFKVLGLDSSEITTCGAVKRSHKVAKMWTGDVFKNSQSQDFGKVINTKKDREDFIQAHYRQFITFVNPDTDVEKLLSKSFKEEIAGIVLTGLHTCGDLAPTCLQMFLRNKKIRGVLSVGCCYHHLTEEYYPENSAKKSEDYGFPLSKFLKDEKYWLGRNARMLAAHSLDRVNSNIASEQSQTSVFYRAILETVISHSKEKTSSVGQVGRLAKKCNTFHEYVFAALKKLNINVSLSENDLDKLYDQYIGKKQLLTAFYLLRISLAPVVESIILLDRVLYLMENGISNVYLVPLFNLEISPRGFGIIAWKNFAFAAIDENPKKSGEETEDQKLYMNRESFNLKVNAEMRNILRVLQEERLTTI